MKQLYEKIEIKSESDLLFLKWGESYSIKMKNEIPVITEPLGRYWEQPSIKDILIDDNYAVMTESTLKQLKDYSRSQPTGVYGGKMWRAGEGNLWYLKWWDNPDENDMCKGNVREILILS
jgi:hypothetical protein